MSDETARPGDQMGNGYKRDDGKRPWSLLPWDALGIVVDLYGMGAKKYSPRNWEAGMDWSRPYDALLRHLTAWWGGEEKDPVDGQHHLTSVVWCALALLTYVIRGVGKDDRPSSRKE